MGAKKSVPKDGLERVMGIEPTRPAWKAGILPLNYTRKRDNQSSVAFFCLAEFHQQEDADSVQQQVIL